MNAVRLFFLSILFVLWGGKALVAQEEGRAVIYMQLLDSVTQEAVPWATISIYPEGQDKAVRYGVSDSEGYVEIVGMPKGKFFLAIEHVSYNTVLQYVSIEKQRTINCGKIWMVERDVQLDDAVVTAQAIVQKGDTTEYNAAFFNPAPTDYLGDLLKKMPGLEIIGSNIFFKGVRVESLTVEGRPFFMGDNTIALENLPAYAVEKVSVFKRKRDKLSGIDNLVNAPLQLNVVLKEGMKTGIIGNLTPSYGTKSRYLVKGLLGHFGKKSTEAWIVSANNTSRNVGNSSVYSAGGMMPAFPMSITSGYEGDVETILTGLDYARNNPETYDLIYMNGVYKHSKSFLTTSSRRETSLTDGFSLYQSDDVDAGSSNEGSLTFRLYKSIEREGKRTIVIDLSPLLGYTKGKQNSNENFSMLREGITRNSSWGEISNKRQTSAGNASLSFGLSMHRSTKLFHFSSFDINGGYSTTKTDNRNGSTTYWSTDTSQIIDQNRKSQQDHLNLGSGISLGLPWDIDFNYDIDYDRSTSKVETWNYNKETETFDRLADDESGYVKNETVEHSLELKKVISIPDGHLLNFWVFTAKVVPVWMRTTAENKEIIYRRWNFVPSISYESRDLDFSYTTAIRHPNLTELQPIMDNSNPLYISEGNPNLRPAYTHSLRFRHSINFLTYNVNGSLTQHKIIRKKTVDSLGVTRSMPINTDMDCQADASIRIVRFPLSRHIALGGTLKGGYVRGVGYDSEKKYHSNSFTGNTSLTLYYSRPFFNFNVNGYGRFSATRFSLHSIEEETTWTTGISGHLDWALPYGINLVSDYTYSHYIGFKSDNKPSSVLDIELCKAVFKKRVIFSIKGYDVLNQSKDLKTTYADNYVEERKVNTIRRYVMFSASFKFGKF